MMKYCLILLFTFTAVTLAAQPEKGEIRSGNRAYSKGNLERAEIDYRRALEQNPGSVHAIYNLGNVLYKRQNAAEAEKLVSVWKDSLASDFLAPKVFHNLGNYTLDQKKYSEAVEYYKSSLRLNPDDDETRSNLAYAQKMLKNEQDKQDKDKKDNKDNKDNKDDKQNQDNKDPDQDNKDQDKKDQPQPPPSITPQAAQQMLQAIQNKEKETQEKVNKEKAKVLQGKQKEKNW
jgi:tetratricopeptide (TPR) repeat protein